MDYIEELRKELWQHSIGTDKRVINRTYCDRIATQMASSTGESVNWETIKEFFEGTRNTALPTLNKFSAYVLKDKSATFLHFKEQCDSLVKNQANILSDREEFDEEKKAKSNKKGVILLASFALLIFLFVLSYRFHLVDPFETEFNNIDPSQLLDGEYSGWKIYDIDSTYLLKQQSKQALTLYTLAGDYWNTPLGNNIIKNIFIKKIHCKSCLIELKLYGFYPNRYRQSAGIFLFEEKDGRFDRDNFVSLTVGSGDNKGNDGSLGINISARLNGESRYRVEQPKINYLDPDSGGVTIPLDTVYIYLHVNSDPQLITSFYRRENERAKRQRIKQTGIQHPYKPKYLGIAGFQITQHNRGVPVLMDTIPIYIDRVRIMELH